MSKFYETSYFLICALVRLHFVINFRSGQGGKFELFDVLHTKAHFYKNNAKPSFATQNLHDPTPISQANTP